MEPSHEDGDASEAEEPGVGHRLGHPLGASAEAVVDEVFLDSRLGDAKRASRALPSARAFHS